MPGIRLTPLQRKSTIALLAAGMLLLVADLRAVAAATKKGVAKPTATKKKTVAKSGTGRTASSRNKTATLNSGTPRKTSSKTRRHRSQTFRSRLARLKLQSDRISEIQQSLAKAGYLNQEPNGRWDDATRKAMLRFQQDNGFPATGLPEAKSLMKLGLGPHPLPRELDATAQASQAAPPSSSGAGGDPASTDPSSRTPQ